MKIILANWRWRWLILAVMAILVLSGLTLSGIAVFGSRAKPAAACPVAIPNHTPESGQVAVSEAENGQTIDLQTGGQLLVDLRFVPSSGNSWSVKEISNPAVLSEVNSVYNLDDV